MSFSFIVNGLMTISLIDLTSVVLNRPVDRI